jgi:ABC-2 type transport system permease protein
MFKSFFAKGVPKQYSRRHSLTQLGSFVGIVLMLNIIGGYFFGHIDLTGDKRFTLTKATERTLNNLKDVVYVEVMLEGEFPAGFKRLRNAVQDFLDRARALSGGKIEYKFTDPLEGSPDAVKELQESLRKKGIFPVNLQVKSDEEYSEKLIYPGALLRFADREIPVKLLENDIPGIPKEVILNNSISLIEYKLMNAIKKLQVHSRPKIAFTTGHLELEPQYTADLEKSLRTYYDIARINLDSIVKIDTEIDLLVVAKPRTAFAEKHKFLFDQYIMHGGKVMWLIDPLNVSLDSMRTRNEVIPYEYPLNLQDLLYKYGCRINNNLALDLQCTKIPLQVGMMGNTPQYELKPWFYYPVAFPPSGTDNPITKGLDGVNLDFPATLDTIRTKTPVTKTILLATSQYSREQYAPVRINFEILHYKPEPAQFNKPHLPMAVLLEGTFPSLYENRITDELNNTLAQLGTEFQKTSTPTKMLVVADGDIASNPFDAAERKVLPLGFNKFEKYTFANKDFLLNAVEYLLDKEGLITARSKEVRLRMLDKVKAQNEKTFWQVLNIALPLLLLALFGVLFNYLRRRRYTIPSSANIN